MLDDLFSQKMPYSSTNICFVFDYHAEISLNLRIRKEFRNHPLLSALYMKRSGVLEQFNNVAKVPL